VGPGAALGAASRAATLTVLRRAPFISTAQGG